MRNLSAHILLLVSIVALIAGYGESKQSEYCEICGAGRYEHSRRSWILPLSHKTKIDYNPYAKAYAKYVNSNCMHVWHFSSGHSTGILTDGTWACGRSSRLNDVSFLFEFIDELTPTQAATIIKAMPPMGRGDSSFNAQVDAINELALAKDSQKWWHKNAKLFTVPSATKRLSPTHR